MYPAYLNLEGRSCLVIGGGNIAQRKTQSLVDAGAKVSVIAPNLTVELQDFVDKGKIHYIKRCFEKGDTLSYFLIIAATNVISVNARIYREAMENHRLINSVDDNQHCNFYVPAQFRRGKLSIAISTQGEAPLLAKGIRKWLEKIIPLYWGHALDKLGLLRRELLKEAQGSEERKQVLMENRFTPELQEILKDLPL